MEVDTLQIFIDSLDMEDEEDFLLYQRLEQFKKGGTYD